MPRYKDESPAVRVYTVCDESRYLTVRNVPALGCGDDLLQLFSSYGEVEECKPMDAEDCEPFTDVYWIKFRLFSNARFAKRKLDDFVFLGNRLQVSYAPHFESLSDTKDKLEGRRREVLARLNPKRSKETTASSSRPLITSNTSFLSEHLDTNKRNAEFEGRSHNGDLSMRTVSSNEEPRMLCAKDKLEGRRREVLARLNPKRSKETTASSTRPLITSNTSFLSEHLDTNKRNAEFEGRSHNGDLSMRTVSSNEDYFASHSMNQTVRLVRDKLDKIQSNGEHLQAGSTSKKARVDNRRRI